MKKTALIITLIFLSCSLIGQQSSQNNDFKIGMFGFNYISVNGLPPTTLKVQGFNSSELNVMSEDGFNVVTRYNPDYWTSTYSMQRIIDLVDMNKMKILTNTKDWYKANPNNPGIQPNGQPHSTLPGNNLYNSTTGSHPNYDLFFENLYCLPSNKNKIWGHQVTEESAFFNGHNYTNNPPDVSNGWPPLNFIETEVPLANTLDAISYFRTKRDGLGMSNQKLIIMEANHSAAITGNLIYDHENNNVNRHYTPKHLLDNVSNDIVFFEGSYMRFPESNWLNSNYNNISGIGPNTYHYLGFAKSIDFAKSKTKIVHDVLSASIDDDKYWNHYHSNPLIKNANYL